MILANITSFIGQCSDSEHYYCHFKQVDDAIPDVQCYIGYGDDELRREITKESEVNHLMQKDKYSRWRVGDTTIKFNTYDEIHNTLKKQFPDEIIVSYDESEIFKYMIYWKDGKNLGVEFFGEVWNEIPGQVYVDLVPIDTKFKCGDCGYEYTMNEISYIQELNPRNLRKFKKKRDMENPCCKWFAIEWNITL